MRLKASEARYRAIVEGQTDLISRFLPDGTLTFVNQAFCRFFGKQHDHLVGTNFMSLLPEEERIKAEGRLVSLRQGKSVPPEDYRVVDGEGKIRWLQWTGRCVGGEQGEVIEIQSVVRDVTEHKLAEEALRQRNRESELLIRAGQVFASTLDLDQVLSVILEEVRQGLGVVASSIWLTDPKTGELVCQEATGSGRERVLGWRMVPGQGLAGWVADTGQSLVVPDAQQDVRYFEGVDERTGLKLRSILTVPLSFKENVIGVIQVVDSEVNRFGEHDLRLVESLAAAASVAIENARLYRETDTLRAFNENIVQGMSEGILLEDATGRVTFVNSQFARLLGYAPEELMGRHWRDTVAPEEVAKVEEEVARRPRGVGGHYETVLLTRDGRRIPVLVSARSLFEEVPDQEDGISTQERAGRFTGVLCVFADITARKRVEEQIQASLREKEVLLREIHHRVKNNMQVISSLLDLQSEAIEDPQALQAFRESRSRIRSMALIHEKLYRSPDLARINAAEYIQDVVDYLLGAYAGSAGDIALTVEVDDIRLDIDSAIPCGLILNELVSNALRHAFPPEQDWPPGKEREIRVEFRCRPQDAHPVLIIGDNGVGLPPGLDFRCTQSLGLQLVNLLVEQIRGSIDLDEGDGTTFRIVCGGG